MATIGAKAEMDKAATARLDKAIATLSERFGIERPEPRRVVHDQHLEAIYGREDMAGLLEALVTATAPPTHVETRPRIAPEAKTFGSEEAARQSMEPFRMVAQTAQVSKVLEFPDEPTDEDDMGKPSKGTPKDKRLSRNKPK